MHVRQTGSSALDLSVRDDGIGVIRLDVPGETHNVLRPELLDELSPLLDEIRSSSQIRAVVFASGKPASFVAGADIKTFANFTSAQQVTALCEQNQAALIALDNLPVPVVAAINGVCLGGGLGLVLACSARIAADTPQVKFGLPESQLGLLAADGTTQRLPRMVGIATALEIMLTGKSLRVAQAHKLGLVDQIVPPQALMAGAIAHADRLAAGNCDRGGVLRGGRSGLRAAVTSMLLEANPVGRRLLFSRARKQLLAQTKGNYPAQERIIDVVEAGYRNGFAAGLAAEAQGFGELAMTPQHHALRSVYRASEQLKKETFVAAGVTPRPVGRVGVLGAGLMGAGIATVTINKAGRDVRLKDKDNDGLAAGLSHVRGFYEQRVRRKIRSRHQAERDLLRLMPASDYKGFGGCDLVIEAVYENLQLKHTLLHDIEALGRDDIMFASSTAAIPIGDIAAVATHPQNVIGMHYAAPVEKMPLLEIVVTGDTAPAVLAACVAFGKAQGKTVIVVADGPGFYTSRVRVSCFNEAAHLLADGVAVEAVDAALTQYGFAVGPLTLLDEVGLGVGWKVGPILEQAFGKRMTVPAGAQQMIEAGCLGRKAGKGFYDYHAKKKNGKRPVNAGLYSLMGVPAGQHVDMGRTEIAERCVLMMVNEAVHCLADDILQHPMHGDIGAIFGLGFPSFTGGPFRLVDKLGTQAVVAKLDAFTERFGTRFEPAPMLRDMARQGRRFHA